MDFDLRHFLREDAHGNMNPDGKMHRAGNIARRVLAAALLLMCSRPMAAQEVDRQLLSAPVQLGETSAVTEVSGPTVAPMSMDAAKALPGAPQPQSAAPSQNLPNPPTIGTAPAPRGSGSGVIALLPPSISQKRLTPKDKFQIYIHQSFGPQNFILPAFGAGLEILHPPSHYLREWKDGGGAFGRWYGEQLAASTSYRTGQFLAETVLHEDPRYVPSGSKNFLMRISHAVAFTFVDKTDSGHNIFAFSNFAGAAAGGFVGMAMLPNGYNDVTHAEQRALRGLGTVVVRNVITEFRPEWEPTLRKIHVPSILPAWWTPRHLQHP